MKYLGLLLGTGLLIFALLFVAFLWGKNSADSVDEKAGTNIEDVSADALIYDANCVVFFEWNQTAFKDVVANFENEYPWLGFEQIDERQATIQGSPNDSCRYKLELHIGPDVSSEAMQLAAGREHENGLRKCNAKIVISIEKLETALDEFNILMEVETGTAEVVDGYVYLPWNGTIIPPEIDEQPRIESQKAESELAGKAESELAGNAESTEHSEMDRVFEIAGFFSAHGFWSISDGEALNPILAYVKNGEKKMERLVGDGSDNAVKLGQTRLRSNEMDADFAVLICDGRIPVGDKKLDALIVEMRVASAPDSEVLLAIPYTPKTDEEFSIHRPEILAWENCEEFDLDAAMDCFFNAVEKHEKGSEIWNRYSNDSK